MLLNAYTVRDSKSDCYTRPFFCDNDGVARRFCADFFLSRAGDVYSLHPDDFSLYRVGSFDDNTGILVSAIPSFVLAFSEFFQLENADVSDN